MVLRAIDASILTRIKANMKLSRERKDEILEKLSEPGRSVANELFQADASVRRKGRKRTKRASAR